MVAFHHAVGKALYVGKLLAAAAAIKPGFPPVNGLTDEETQDPRAPARLCRRSRGSSSAASHGYRWSPGLASPSATGGCCLMIAGCRGLVLYTELDRSGRCSRIATGEPRESAGP